MATNIERRDKMSIKQRRDKMSIEQRREDWRKLAKLLREKRIPSILDILDEQTSFLTGSFRIDIMKVDRLVPNYDGDRYLYKGKPEYSLAMAIKEEWGSEIYNLIKRLV